jgi:hypothetical protein
MHNEPRRRGQSIAKVPGLEVVVLAGTSMSAHYSAAGATCQNLAFATTLSGRFDMDINKQLAALTTSELQTAGASQATAIALSVVLRHLASPELQTLLKSAYRNHQAVMQQTPWPDQMLQSFEATRRFLEAAAQQPEV